MGLNDAIHGKHLVEAPLILHADMMWSKKHFDEQHKYPSQLRKILKSMNVEFEMDWSYETLLRVVVSSYVATVHDRDIALYENQAVSVAKKNSVSATVAAGGGDSSASRGGGASSDTTRKSARLKRKEDEERARVEQIADSGKPISWILSREGLLCTAESLPPRATEWRPL